MKSGYNPIDVAKSQINWRFLMLCFVLGALCGTTGDFVHVITQTDRYPHNGLFPFLPLLPVEMPVWVPFLFGGAVMLMGVAHKLLSSAFRPRLAGNKMAATLAPFIFVMLYALSGEIHAGTGGLQDVWLALAAILYWWVADGTAVGAMLALLTAVGGTLFEIFLVSVNGFSYYPQHANLLGVPSWLPWLYVAASVTVSLVVRWF
jgi:hypothetical protein